MTTETEHPRVDSFANHVLGDWESAIGRFFSRVEVKRVARGLTTEQVREALDLGYGDVVADSWAEWAGEF